MLLFAYRKVVYRPTPTANPEEKNAQVHTIYMVFVPRECSWICFDMHSPRACWRTSLAHNMMRKGKLFWSQRRRQRSSENELLGSLSRSVSGGPCSVSGLEWDCAWVRPCGWEREWLWELALHRLDEEAPLGSPLVTCTRASSPSAAVPATGARIASAGCRVKVKPLSAWAPGSLRLGCITARVSLGFTALLEKLLQQQAQED